jgi:hypothetical protein
MMRLGPAGLSAMLRTCSRIIALAVMLVGLQTAQAADTTLTLACKGTTTDNMKDAKGVKPEPLSIGVIVNFTTRAVQGLLLPASESVPISEVNDLTIAFDGGTAP